MTQRPTIPPTTRIDGNPPHSYRLTAIGLRRGLGVEDIAVKCGLPVELIRQHVAAMRANGDLKAIVARLRGAA